MNTAIEKLKLNRRILVAFEHLTKRERYLLLLGCGVFTLAIGFFLVVPMVERYFDLREQLQKKEAIFEKIEQNKKKYVETSAKWMAFDSRINKPAIDLNGYLTEVAKKTLGKELNAFEPQKDQQNNGITSRAVKVNLGNVTQSALIGFIQEVENDSSRFVAISSINIRALDAKGEFLDASMIIANYFVEKEEKQIKDK